MNEETTTDKRNMGEEEMKPTMQEAMAKMQEAMDMMKSCMEQEAPDEMESVKENAPEWNA